MSDKGNKDCPLCAEEIKVRAKKCKHCGEYLDKSLINKVKGKATKRPRKKKENKVTSDTVLKSFYVKKDLFEKLHNFAYWDRHTITEAFNIVLKDGLKDKNTKPKK